MSRGQKNESHNPYRPNAAYVVLKLLSKAFDRGQLFYMVFGLIIVIGVCKIPGKDILPFMERVLRLLQNFSILGWVLFMLTVLISTITVGQLRYVYQKEIDRLSAHKKELQERLTDEDLPSSDRSL